jgi:hypothetical protein
LSCMPSFSFFGALACTWHPFSLALKWPSSGSTKKWLIYSDCIVSVSVICTKVINCAYLCIPMSLILFTVFSVWPILIPKIFLFT